MQSTYGDAQHKRQLAQMTLNITTLSINCHYAECCHGECRGASGIH